MIWETKKELRRERDRFRRLAKYTGEALEQAVEKNNLLEAEVSMLREEYHRHERDIIALRQALQLSEQHRRKLAARERSWTKVDPETGEDTE